MVWGFEFEYDVGFCFAFVFGVVSDFDVDYDFDFDMFCKGWVLHSLSTTIADFAFVFWFKVVLGFDC